MRFLPMIRGDILPILAIGIVVSACGGSSAEPSQVVAGVVVTPASVSRPVGASVQLTATVKDAAGNSMSGQSVEWESSAPSVASVSTSGLVTANTLGSAVITASAGSRSGHATFTVVPDPIASISVSPVTDTLLQGETVQLTATLRDAANNVVTGRTVSWASSPASIASVSNNGLVTGTAEGAATITVSVDDKAATANIRVIGRCEPFVAGSIAVGQTANGTLSATDCRIVDCVLCGFHPSDSSYADLYAISANSATDVQIDMIATYDTYLWLWELRGSAYSIAATNNDGDPDDPSDPTDSVDRNARLLFTLAAGKTYIIFANALVNGVTGDYQLKVTSRALGKFR